MAFEQMSVAEDHLEQKLERLVANPQVYLNYLTRPDWAESRIVRLSLEPHQPVQEFRLGPFLSTLALNLEPYITGGSSLTKGDAERFQDQFNGLFATLSDLHRALSSDESFRASQQRFLVASVERDAALLASILSRMTSYSFTLPEHSYRACDVPVFHAEQFLPPDDVEPEPRHSHEEENRERAGIAHRVEEALRLCEDLDWTYERHVGALPVENIAGARQYEALLITLPTGRRSAVLVTDAPGNATYIIRDVAGLSEVLQLTQQTKQELRDLRLTTGKVNWLAMHPSWQLWREELRHLVTKENEIPADEIPDRDDYPYTASSVGRLVSDALFERMRINASVNDGFIRRLAQLLVDEHGLSPRHLALFPTKGEGFSPRYTQKLAHEVVDLLLTYWNPDKEYWMSIGALKEQFFHELGRRPDFYTIETVAVYFVSQFGDEHRQWFFSTGGKERETLPDGSPNSLRLRLHYSAEVREAALAAYREVIPPEGWMTVGAISSSWGFSHETIQELLESPNRSADVRRFFLASGKAEYEGRGEQRYGLSLVPHYDPAFVENIHQQFKGQNPPEGWVNIEQCCERWSMDRRTLQRIFSTAARPGVDQGIYSPSPRLALVYYEPGFVQKTLQELFALRPPETWITVTQFAQDLGRNNRNVQPVLDRLANSENSGLFWIVRGGDTQDDLIEAEDLRQRYGVRFTRYYSPQLIARAREEILSRK